MSADSEEILDDAVHRCKTLQMGSRLEPAHLAFPLAGRLLRDFRAIVFILPGTVDQGRHHGTVRGRVTAQLVRDQPARLAAFVVSTACGRTAWPPAYCAATAQDVKDVAVFVDSTPQILLPALDLDEQLVQMPGAALAAPAVPQPPCVVEPERSTPLPNRLIRHGDPPFGEEVFDIPETQAETVVEPDGVTDDFRGKSVSAVDGRPARHRATLPLAAQLDNADNTLVLHF